MLTRRTTSRPRAVSAAVSLSLMPSTHSIVITRLLHAPQCTAGTSTSGASPYSAAKRSALRPSAT